jgi:hypothetical protein
MAAIRRTANNAHEGVQFLSRTRRISADLERVPVMLNHFSGVMAGLVPAIHAFLAERPQERHGCPRQARA